MRDKNNDSKYIWRRLLSNESQVLTQTRRIYETMMHDVALEYDGTTWVYIYLSIHVWTREWIHSSLDHPNIV